MANKITKRVVINAMLGDEAIASNEMYVSYLKNELALLDKKATNKKATKNQEANVGIKELIVATLKDKGTSSISQLQKANAELGTLSNQKISALLRQLIEADRVVRGTDKRVAVFTLVEAD